MEEASCNYCSTVAGRASWSWKPGLSSHGDSKTLVTHAPMHGTGQHLIHLINPGHVAEGQRHSCSAARGHHAMSQALPPQDTLASNLAAQAATSQPGSLQQGGTEQPCRLPWQRTDAISRGLSSGGRRSRTRGKEMNERCDRDAAEERRPTASIFTPIFPFQFLPSMKVPIQTADFDTIKNYQSI